MSTALRIRQMTVYPLRIPMRLRFEHAAASRNAADPVVVQLQAEAPLTHVDGYGETLARRYVTGETADTVVDYLVNVFSPRLLDLRAGSFADALEFIAELPFWYDGRNLNAARAAIELALIDLAGRAFRRPATDIAAWRSGPIRASHTSPAAARYSGIVVGRKALKQSLMIRAQRAYGLRDFKIKVAVEGWEQRLRRASTTLGGALAAGAATLRADANGGWTPAEAAAALPVLEECGVSALEQPVSREEDAAFADLAAASRRIDLIADESLVTSEDADRLLEDGAVRVFNVRIAKNGGLLPSLELAHRAREAGRDVQLGCLVGETSILTAAGVAFLSLVPDLRFVEGAFGGWLLRRDVVPRPLTFGRGGRPPRVSGDGFGIEVDPARLEALADGSPTRVQF